MAKPKKTPSEKGKTEEDSPDAQSNDQPTKPKDEPSEQSPNQPSDENNGDNNGVTADDNDSDSDQEKTQNGDADKDESKSADEAEAKKPPEFVDRQLKKAIEYLTSELARAG